jgi:hypothetical protein
MNTHTADHAQLVVSPREARHMIDCGNTKFYELLNAKQLDSYLDGRSRKVTVASIHSYIARKLAAAGVPGAAVQVAPHPRRRDRPRKVSPNVVRP